MMSGVRASSIRIESTSSTIAIVISALDLLLARGGHAVVAQIIETELAIRAVGDVHRVLLAADIRRLDRAECSRPSAREIVKLAHPFRVAAREVIVHRHQMRAACP